MEQYYETQLTKKQNGLKQSKKEKSSSLPRNQGTMKKSNLSFHSISKEYLNLPCHIVGRRIISISRVT